MKLVIQIPCFNEADTLPDVLADLPKAVDGFDEVEYLVINDGSTDRTSEVAREHGAHHVLELGTNRGLATAFQHGVEAALDMGADVLVNTDGDNQFVGSDAPKLTRPILAGQADLVVGCRPITSHPEFGTIKKLLQLAGSWTLRKISNTNTRDAASGFRAFSRETCQRLYVFSRFSYCMETLIQAGNSGLRVASTDIRINPKTRDSRLFKSVPQYLWKSGSTMLAMFILYRPGRFFSIVAGFFLSLAMIIGLRYMYLTYWTDTVDPRRTYIPSLILLVVLAITGVFFLGLGVLGELLKTLRHLQQESVFLQRRAIDLAKNPAAIADSP